MYFLNENENLIQLDEGQKYEDPAYLYIHPNEYNDLLLLYQPIFRKNYDKIFKTRTNFGKNYMNLVLNLVQKFKIEKRISFSQVMVNQLI